jgi:hypothetical protein
LKSFVLKAAPKCAEIWTNAKKAVFGNKLAQEVGQNDEKWKFRTTVQLLVCKKGKLES